jgi:hypothetical protein
MFVTWAQGVMGAGQSTPKVPAASGNSSGLYEGLGSDTIKVALYNNTGTPSETDTAAHAAYNGTGGPWVTANEVTDATNWVAGGRALASKTLNNSSNVFTFDAADLAGGGNVTISNAYGCLVYDDNITAGTGGVADLGVCFNSFGSGQSVTAGTFTIVWNASGIFTVTV